jgi:hypothetical protein
MVKSLKKLEMEGMSDNTIKVMYDKPIASIILNGENLKSFLLKSGMRQRCPHSPFIQCSTWILSQNKKARERNIWDTNRKGRWQITPICGWYDPILKRP